MNITVSMRAIPVFLTLLQEGVTLKGNIGISVRDAIKEHLGITDEYIDKKVSTILLNGSVVDDMDRATIDEGSVLALSGAMPGLVGATMRTHSPYASFRNVITYKEKNRLSAVKKGVFQIKLFNVLLEDLGLGLLKKGILVNPERVRLILKTQSKIDIKGISLDGMSLGLDELDKRLSDEAIPIIELTVNNL
ncbi:MAG: hypothetical protein N3D15_03535 [Syntrophorhabdaceae bacterium]|nr:hypothetical protein [Syntrophorhabdaceae bacterium]